MYEILLCARDSQGSGGGGEKEGVVSGSCREGLRPPRVTRCLINSDHSVILCTVDHLEVLFYAWSSHFLTQGIHAVTELVPHNLLLFYGVMACLLTPPQ